MKELIIDSFAGGGGASLGIAWATGRAPDIAINHDASAITMHEANHPSTLHVLEDVWKTDLKKLVKRRKVGLLWLSPDCKHFSRAKGSKPVEKQIRSLAWIACKWANEVRPRIIVLENVREFRSWGPLVPRLKCSECEWKGTKGQAILMRVNSRCPSCNSKRLKVTEEMVPCPDRQGLTFKRFVGRLKNLGYVVEWRDLDAADYGAPTHRKRLFLIARCDGQPIEWPEPTHAPAKRVNDMPLFGQLKPYRTAAECIDWSVPCPSIFERKRPLAEKTLRRIAHGIKRYVLDTESPFIVNARIEGGIDAITSPILSKYHGQKSESDSRCKEMEEPFATLDTQPRFALVAPTLMRQFGRSDSADISAPLPTVVDGGGGKTALVAAFIAKHFGGMVGVEAGKPLPTTTTRGTQNQLVTANLIHMNHGAKQWSSVEDPLRTVTSNNHAALVYAFLVKFFGTSNSASLKDPMPTTTTRDRFGYVTVQVDNETYVITDIGMRMLTPRELARAQGFPYHSEWEFKIMTRDEVCVAAIANQDILVDFEKGEVYRTRGPGGIKLKKPILVEGSNVNGYRCMNLSAGGSKRQVRLHRLVWIAKNGIPPDGLIVAHINNSKVDNRIANLKLLTPEQNSTEAARDGLYKTPPCQKLDVEVRKQLVEEYRGSELTQKEIAKKYGVSLSRVAQILRSHDYILTGTKTSQVARIGNSVCPAIAKAIVEANYAHVPVA